MIFPMSWIGNRKIINCLPFFIQVKKVFLASIRPPKLEGERPQGQFRPLYDVPFMFEAREFMRKKLIGQNVHVIVDYIQPTSEDANGYSYPEKICGTVTIGGVNVAEALVSKGNNIDWFKNLLF